MSVMKNIKCYTAKSQVANIDSMTVIDNNENYFNLYYEDLDIFSTVTANKPTSASKYEIQVLTGIDGVTGVSKSSVKTPFGIAKVDSLSLSAKTLLNAILILKRQWADYNDGVRPDEVILNVEHLGWNSMQLLLEIIAKIAFTDAKGCSLLKLITGASIWADIYDNTPLEYAIVYNDNAVFKTAGECTRFIVENSIQASVFSSYIDAQKANEIVHRIFMMQDNGGGTTEKLAFPRLSMDIDTIKFNFEFKSKLTVVIGNSGFGKSFFTKVIKRTKTDQSKSSIATNIEIFDSSNPLNDQSLSFLESKKDTSRLLIIIDDAEYTITEEQAKRLYTLGAQVVIFSAKIRNMVYGVQDLAIPMQFDNTIVLVYPLSVNGTKYQLDEQTKFLLTNRPAWSLSGFGINVALASLIQIRDNIERYKPNMETIMSKYSLPTVSEIITDQNLESLDSGKTEDDEEFTMFTS